jgi:hypothetical protein
MQINILVDSWAKGIKNIIKYVNAISEKLVIWRSNIPREFSRKPRSLSEIKQWKATEVRLFLLYTDPVALKGILSNEKYGNVLDLSLAIHILLSPNLLEDYYNLLKKC